MKYKHIILAALASLFLLACDSQGIMGMNPLRSQNLEIERQQEQIGREQETQYGTRISQSFKKTSSSKLTEAPL